MSQAGYTPLSLYYSTTASAVPTAGNLNSGELAINITDGKLYYKSNAGVVTLIASSAGASGDVVGPASSTDNALARFDLATGKLIQNSVGILSDAGILTGLTGLTSSGSITLSSLTSGRVVYSTTAGLLTDSANLTFNGTTLTANTIGAYTLSGTIAGGGNQINNVIIGTSTPLAGSFTTINASTSITNAGLTSGRVTYAGASGLLSDSANLNFDGSNLLVGSTSSTFTSAGRTVINANGSAQALLGLSVGGTGVGYLYHNGTDITLMNNVSTGVAIFGTNNTERMRIDSSGNVGIGTSSPSQKLDVNGFVTTTPGLGSGGGFIVAYGSGSANSRSWKIRQDDAAYGDFAIQQSTTQTGSTYATLLTIDRTGNVGIGTSSPSFSAGGGLQVVNGTFPTVKVTYTGNTGVDFSQDASSNAYLYNRDNGAIIFGTNNTIQARLDASGNLGLGVTPSAWGSNYKALQIGAQTCLYNAVNYVTSLNTNAYEDSAGALRRIAAGEATRYVQAGGAHQWFSAANGSAGAVATFTQAMTLDADGDLGIGNTAPTYRLDAYQTSRSSGANYSTSAMDASTIVRVAGGENDTSKAATLTFTQFNSSASISCGYASTFAGFLAFGTTNGSSGSVIERMRIDSSGNLGIGTSSPAGKLAVYTSPMSNQLIFGPNTSNVIYGAISFSGDNSDTGRIGFTGGGNPDKALYLDVPSTGAFYCRIAAINRLEISASGILTASAYGVGTATFAANGTISSVSDETWKTKDGVPTNPDVMLQKLEPGYWFYNEEKAPTFGADRQLGFYAQNVHEAIGAEAAPTPEEGKPWGYYDRSVLSVVVMSLKNALNTIEELKQRITTLENK